MNGVAGPNFVVLTSMRRSSPVSSNERMAGACEQLGTFVFVSTLSAAVAAPFQGDSESGVWPGMERGRRCGGSLAAGALGASRKSPSGAFAPNEPSKEAHDSEVS